MTDSIKLDRDGGTLWIRLNRPDVFNSFDEEMGTAFVEALAEGEDQQVRCVVVTGEGKAFCAGEDLKALSGEYSQGSPDLGKILRRRYLPAIETIQSLRKPVLAGVNGVAAGAGVSVALACDYRVMSDAASFVLAFSKVGLIPDAGATWLLPKYLGIGRALEVAFTGDRIDSALAHEWGLVNEVIPASEFEAELAKRAETFATGPSLAYGLTKDLMWKATGGFLSKHLQAEADAQGTAGSSLDHLEGVKAFNEKREPDFKGK